MLTRQLNKPQSHSKIEMLLTELTTDISDTHHPYKSDKSCKKSSRGRQKHKRSRKSSF